MKTKCSLFCFYCIFIGIQHVAVMIREKLLYMPAYMQTVFLNIMPMQLKAMTNQGDNYVLIIFVFVGDLEAISTVCNVVEVISANVL